MASSGLSQKSKADSARRDQVRPGDVVGRNLQMARQVLQQFELRLYVKSFNGFGYFPHGAHAKYKYTLPEGQSRPIKNVPYWVSDGGRSADFSPQQAPPAKRGHESGVFERCCGLKSALRPP